MTLYRSVTAAWLWIVHAATIPAIQSVCKRWFDDSIQTAECLHRTWRYSPMRACVRRSGLSVVLQWKCVFMLSWCCVSVVTGQVLWDCARNVSSPSFPFFVFPTLTRFISTTQPIADMSPMRRSTSSLTPQRGVREVSLSDYDLERPKMSPGQTLDQERERERAHHHHHHHHHRCQRRRDKKHKSLDRAISEEQPPPAGGLGFPLSFILLHFSAHPCERK